MSDLRINAIYNTNANVFAKTITGRIIKASSTLSRDDTYICIECGEKLIFACGEIRQPHFRHHSDTKCTADLITHKVAIDYLVELLSKCNLTIRAQCKAKCILETILAAKDTFIIEKEHVFEHNSMKCRADIAFLCKKTRKLMIIFEIKNTHATAEGARPEPWYEVDAAEVIEKYETMVRDGWGDFVCSRKRICNICEPLSGKLTIPNSGKIYFNQRGAGTGKTYESIQLLRRTPGSVFEHKTHFIYLTKMHSAKHVICQELYGQIRDNKLDDLKIKEDDNGSSKQYKITLQSATMNPATVIIGTIDSFNYALKNAQNEPDKNDYFNDLAKKISEGKNNVSIGKDVKYGGNVIDFSAKCLIIIDEAQDLTREYLDAMITIMKATEIDIYIIGDKLQAISSCENLFTYAESLLGSRQIVKSKPGNHIMRFHHKSHVDFVNKVVDFEKRGLPKISGFCGWKNCIECTESTKESMGDNIMSSGSCVELWQVGSLKVSNTNEYYIESLYKRIIETMRDEVSRNGYLPQDFMFIFPIMKGNVFAVRLREYIQDFWMKNMENSQNYDKYEIEYHKDVENIEYSPPEEYCILHKSEDGQSINLEESKYATQILSIHTSKGNGRKVVFLFGVSEDALCRFTTDKTTLVYESLLHVAITRQKRKLYIGIELNNDDIHERMRSFSIIPDKNIAPNLHRISKYAKHNRIEDIMLKAYSKFEKHFSNYEKCIPDSKTKPLIDWSHHTLRYGVMVYYFMIALLRDGVCTHKDMSDDKKQYYAQLSNISISKMIGKNFKEYQEELWKIVRENNQQKWCKYIPIFQFKSAHAINSEYRKSARCLIAIIRHLRSKLNGVRGGMYPKMCPVECVVIYYIVHVQKNGAKSEASIMDIYKILHCYADNFNDELTERDHSDYGCICTEIFKKDRKCSSLIDELSDSGDDVYADIDAEHDTNIKSDTTNAVVSHFDEISRINKISKSFNKMLSECNIGGFSYNTCQQIYCSGIGAKGVSDFAISKTFQIIGYSKTTVVHFLFKPSFNQLNFASVMCEIAVSNFIIKHCCGEHAKPKFADKKIYAAILTFDSDIPIMIDLDIPDADMCDDLNTDHRRWSERCSPEEGQH